LIYDSKSLQFFQQSWRFTDVSGLWFSLFPYIGEVEQIHTHTAFSNKSLLLHKAPSVKSTPLYPHYFITKMLEKNIRLVNYSGNIYLQFCVALFQLSVSRFSEMQHSAIYLETWGSTTLFCILDTCILFLSLFLVDHTQHQIPLHRKSQCLLRLVSSVFTWFVYGACLLCLAVNITHSLTPHLSNQGW
jgi:hypothetical protein